MTPEWYTTRVISVASLLSPPAEPVYTPFEQSGYTQRNKIASLLHGQWQVVTNEDSAALLLQGPPNTPSKFRHTGLAIWDAVVGIPNDGARKALEYGADIPATRQCNTHWLNVLRPALYRVGPLVDGRLLRTTANYVFDLCRIADGAVLLQAAHALAHQRMLPRGTNWFRRTGCMARAIQQAIADVVVAKLTGLCIDPKQPGRLSGGLLVRVADLELPVLRVPCNGPGSPLVDETVACVTVGVYNEPPPAGYFAGTDAYALADRWSLAPTVIALAGFELVDVLTHQPLERIRGGYNYIEHPADLMPMTLFSELLEHLPAVGFPNGVTAGELLQGGKWRDETPPWPCLDCIRVAWRAVELKPPKEHHPEPAEYKRFKPDHPCVKYKQAVTRILGIIEKATVAECAVAGGSLKQAAAQRRKQAAAYRQRLLKNQGNAVRKIRAKQKKGLCLTRDEVNLLKQS